MTCGNRCPSGCMTDDQLLSSEASSERKREPVCVCRVSCVFNEVSEMSFWWLQTLAQSCELHVGHRGSGTTACYAS